MDILIKNANLISMSSNRERLEEGMDILISGNVIKKIGKNISGSDDVKVIDATGKVVMPGLVNAHAHLGMSVFRETLDGYALQDWLSEKIWPIEDNMKVSDVYYSSYLSLIEMVKSGCTTANDMYFLVEGLLKATLEVGIRLQTTMTLMTQDCDKRLSILSDLIKNYGSNEMITFNSGVHGLYTVNKEALIKFLKFSKDNGIGVHMHFCENSVEVSDIKKEYKVQSPVDVIEEYFTESNTILAHAVKLDCDEIERLGKLKNISVVHCPVSNLRLGCGIADIKCMLDNNINVALGTDGQGSGSNLDMFEVMKYTALLQKGINENPKVLSSYEVLKMATVNGAKALGYKDIGYVEENMKADLIILNTNSVYLQPINDIFSDIVYNAKGSDVDTTIVNGKILMEDKKINFVNEEEIYKECAKISKGIGF